jgi:hypothetical protein
MVGGTISKLSGGKFRSGARSAAISHLFSRAARSGGVQSNRSSNSGSPNKNSNSNGNFTKIKGNLKVDESNAPKGFKKDVEAAIEDIEATGDTTFSELSAQNDKQVIIRYTEGGSYHGVGKNTGNSYIYWNPREGLVFSDGTMQSPAAGLIHEAGHSYDYLINGIDTVNMPERNIIRGIETDFANFYGEGTRKYHPQGDTFDAACAICNFSE